MSEGWLTIGEVHTGLLQNSSAVPLDVATQLLSLVQGERARYSRRPIHYVRSPETLTGIDCDLPSTSGAKVRAVGTVVTHAVLTGGHVVQGSAYTRVEPTEAKRGRQRWSYYLARRGVIESIGRVDFKQVADGFLAGQTGQGRLDLAAIGQRTLDEVQRRDLDNRILLRTSRTRLRFAITADAASPDVVYFGITDGFERTLRLPHRGLPVAELIAWCEDVALHDWLLTMLLTIVDRSRVGVVPPQQALTALKPAFDHLIHLWMPGARTKQELADLWEALEQRPGMSRQWSATVARIRDQITLALLDHPPGG